MLVAERRAHEDLMTVGLEGRQRGPGIGTGECAEVARERRAAAHGLDAPVVGAVALARGAIALHHHVAELRPLPKLSQETLAEMVGTTRSRVNFFMNKFRKLGFIEYNGHVTINTATVTDTATAESRTHETQWSGSTVTISHDPTTDEIVIEESEALQLQTALVLVRGLSLLQFG